MHKSGRYTKPIIEFAQHPSKKVYFEITQKCKNSSKHEICCSGKAWEEFEVPIRINFAEKTGREPLEIMHKICLENEGHFNTVSVPIKSSYCNEILREEKKKKLFKLYKRDLTLEIECRL